MFKFEILSHTHKHVVKYSFVNIFIKNILLDQSYIYIHPAMLKKFKFEG